MDKQIGEYARKYARGKVPKSMAWVNIVGIAIIIIFIVSRIIAG